MSNKKKVVRWSMVAFMVVLLIALLLSWRTPAAAQTPDVIVQEQFEAARANIQSLGLETSGEVLGLLSENPEALSEMQSVNQPVLFFDGRQVQLFSIANLGEKAGAYERTIEAFGEEMARIEKLVDPEKTWVVAFRVNGELAIVLIDDTGTQTYGVFSTLSRIMVPAIYSNYPVDQNINIEKLCSEKILSRNIFGQVAERARVCTESVCQSARPTRCQVVEKASRHWLFGAVEFTPPDQPEEGQVDASLCTGRGYYKWSAGFQGLKLFGHEAEIPGFSQGATGSLTARIDCDQS